MGKIVKVEGVQIMRGSNLLYSAPPGYDDERLCEHCGKRAPKSPCPHCGYPINRPYVKPSPPRFEEGPSYVWEPADVTAKDSDDG